VRRLGLSQMNPDVFPLLFGNGIGWLIYAACTRDAFLFASIFVNILVGMFYVLTVYMLAESDAARRKIEIRMILILGIWSALGFSAPQIADEELRNHVVGAMALFLNLLLFATPLSTISTVIRNKSAASISLPFAIMQVQTLSLSVVRVLASALCVSLSLYPSFFLSRSLPLCCARAHRPPPPTLTLLYDFDPLRPSKSLPSPQPQPPHPNPPPQPSNTKPATPTLTPKAPNPNSQTRSFAAGCGACMALP
jgi:hypothetical protein